VLTKSPTPERHTAETRFADVLSRVPRIGALSFAIRSACQSSIAMRRWNSVPDFLLFRTPRVALVEQQGRAIVSRVLRQFDILYLSYVSGNTRLLVAVLALDVAANSVHIEFGTDWSSQHMSEAPALRHLLGVLEIVATSSPNDAHIEVIKASLPAAFRLTLSKRIICDDSALTRYMLEAHNVLSPPEKNRLTPGQRLTQLCERGRRIKNSFCAGLAGTATNIYRRSAAIITVAGMLCVPRIIQHTETPPLVDSVIVLAPDRSSPPSRPAARSVWSGYYSFMAPIKSAAASRPVRSVPLLPEHRVGHSKTRLNSQAAKASSSARNQFVPPKGIIRVPALIEMAAPPVQVVSTSHPEVNFHSILSFPSAPPKRHFLRRLTNALVRQLRLQRANAANKGSA
jgi:hypothetical protein